MYREFYSKLLVLLAFLFFTITGNANVLAIGDLYAYPEPEGQIIPGDVNGDSIVSIRDVTALIDMLLTNCEMTDQADVNGDGIVSIKDVTVLIDMLLADMSPGEPDPPTYLDAPSILILGNSFTEDAWAYVPYLLKEYGINIKIGMYVKAGGGLSDLRNEYYTGTSLTGINLGFYYFDTAKQDGWEKRYNRLTPQNSVVYYDGMENDAEPDSSKLGQLWDVIVFQQVSSASVFRSAFGLQDLQTGTLINSMIPLLMEMVSGDMQKEEFSFGWNVNHSKGGAETDLPTDILANIEEVCGKNGISLIFPYGTGIFNGRNYEALKSVGLNGSTDLWYDGQHLAGGLPDYLAAITIIEAIFRNYYGDAGLTVMGNPTIPDLTWLSGKSFPSPRADKIVGVTAENCALAQEAAINAFVDPWHIYGGWPLSVFITCNSNCYISDAGNYPVSFVKEINGNITKVIQVPYGASLDSIVIKANDGYSFGSGSSHNWRYTKNTSIKLAGANDELDRGIFDVDSLDNTICVIKLDGEQVVHNISTVFSAI